jgi:pre-mRNA-splicing factor ATP-dependent RNA helicase DHX15/PRP43
MKDLKENTYPEI